MEAKAGGNGHLEVVKWLDAHFIKEGFDTRVNIDRAARYGKLEVVKWLHAHRTDKSTVAAVNGGSERTLGDGQVAARTPIGRLYECRQYVAVFQRAQAKIMDMAAAHGYLNVQWLHSGVRCTTSAMNFAAAKGHFDMVKWLHANRSEGCTTMAIDLTACNGHLEIVRWLHEYSNAGCTTDAMDFAAANGYFSVVRWLHENREEGCTATAMTEAARWGDLPLLEFLHFSTHRGLLPTRS